MVHHVLLSSIPGIATFPLKSIVVLFSSWCTIDGPTLGSTSWTISRYLPRVLRCPTWLAWFKRKYESNPSTSTLNVSSLGFPGAGPQHPRGTLTLPLCLLYFWRVLFQMFMLCSLLYSSTILLHSSYSFFGTLDSNDLCLCKDVSLLLLFMEFTLAS